MQFFQRLLSKIKTPNYIKSITIKELDLGRDPPFATALRMLPADSAGALALEVDLEWYSGGFITIETRVDVRDQIAQEKVASQMSEPGSAGAAAAAIVSGIGEDLETADVNAVLDARQSAVTKKPGPGIKVFTVFETALTLCFRSFFSEDSGGAILLEGP